MTVCTPCNTSPATKLENGRYKVTIAANNSVPYDHAPEVRLGALQFETYRKSPVVLWNHRDLIGKTHSICRNDQGGIEAEFEFANTTKAAEIEDLWTNGFVRGASIRWYQPKDGKPFLEEWSLVSIPADKEATRSPNSTNCECTMNDDERTNEQLPKTLDTDATDAIVESVLADQKLMQRITDAEARAAAAEARAAKVELRAEIADASTQYRELLNSQHDFESMKDLLLSACGDTVENAESRSVDYLRAAADGLMAARAKAKGPTVDTTETPITGFSVSNYTANSPLWYSVRRFADARKLKNYYFERRNSLAK